VERIRRSLGRLTRLTETMLQSAGQQQPESGLPRGNTPISDCIENALNESLPLARKNNLTVLVKLAGTAANLTVDSERMERVLINLIENSCKFTPAGGTIQIRAYRVKWQAPGDPSRTTPWGLRVDVVDTGSGIAAEDLERVFEESVSAPGIKNTSGRGLGLAICKTMITAQGGRIWAQRHRGGAKISLLLPAGAHNPAWERALPGQLVPALQTA
jgi:signal transduction histidine kinase